MEISLSLKTERIRRIIITNILCLIGYSFSFRSHAIRNEELGAATRGGWTAIT